MIGNFEGGGFRNSVVRQNGARAGVTLNAIIIWETRWIRWKDSLN